MSRATYGQWLASWLSFILASYSSTLTRTWSISPWSRSNVDQFRFTWLRSAAIRNCIISYIEEVTRRKSSTSPATRCDFGGQQPLKRPLQDRTSRRCWLWTTWLTKSGVSSTCCSRIFWSICSKLIPKYGLQPLTAWSTSFLTIHASRIVSQPRRHKSLQIISSSKVLNRKAGSLPKSCSKGTTFESEDVTSENDYIERNCEKRVQVILIVYDLTRWCPSLE